jgi:hypothetical protein
MSDLKPSTRYTASCDCEFGMECMTFAPGHALPLIQDRLASATASKWRDAVVAEVADDGWTRLVTIDDQAQVWVWNHASAEPTISEGEPVAIHALYNVLAVGRTRLNVFVSDGDRR